MRLVSSLQSSFATSASMEGGGSVGNVPQSVLIRCGQKDALPRTWNVEVFSWHVAGVNVGYSIAFDRNGIFEASQVQIQQTFVGTTHLRLLAPAIGVSEWSHASNTRALLQAVLKLKAAAATMMVDDDPLAELMMAAITYEASKPSREAETCRCFLYC